MRIRGIVGVCGVLQVLAGPIVAAETNVLGGSFGSTSAPLPDATGSVFRVLAALAVVMAVFVGMLWVIRNWQNLLAKRNGSPKLVIEEARAIGNRSTLYLIAHADRTLLIASSPQGVHFLADLSNGPGFGRPTVGLEPPKGSSTSSFEKELIQRTSGGL